MVREARRVAPMMLAERSNQQPHDYHAMRAREQLDAYDDAGCLPCEYFRARYLNLNLVSGSGSSMCLVHGTRTIRAPHACAHHTIVTRILV